LTFELDEVLGDNDLLSASDPPSHHVDPLYVDFECPTGWPLRSAKYVDEPALVLRIRAAADFFSLNQTLMNNPPPVGIDIILDPYILNVLPESLLPTVVYITVLSIVGWFLSGVISKWLHGVAQLSSSQKKAA